MGLCSWRTADTEKSVLINDKQRQVYLLQPNGQPPIPESSYEGYGVFGGVDAYVWQALNNPTTKRVRATLEALRINPDDLPDLRELLINGKSVIDNPSLIRAISHIPLIADIIHKGQGGLEILKKQLRNTAISDFFDKKITLEYPLKFSHDSCAIYEQLPPSVDCPNQGCGDEEDDNYLDDDDDVMENH